MARSEQDSFASSTAQKLTQEQRRDRIRALNDQLRRLQSGGRLMITAGIQALGEGKIVAVVAAVARFDSFEAGDDPYGEHDFGALDVLGERIFWKIDYYDQRLEFGSPDPADPAVTTRVLTIMLASEY